MVLHNAIPHVHFDEAHTHFADECEEIALALEHGQMNHQVADHNRDQATSLDHHHAPTNALAFLLDLLGHIDHEDQSTELPDLFLAQQEEIQWATFEVEQVVIPIQSEDTDPDPAIKQAPAFDLPPPLYKSPPLSSHHLRGPPSPMMRG